MKREMRRKDRMISEEECLKALEEAEYGSLATISEDGTTSPGITMHVSASWTPWN